MTEARCALYARVSSEAQTRDNTIASQVTALHERIAADGFVLEPGYSYQDDGYSGSILLRPALERLRDAVASGHVASLRPCSRSARPPLRSSGAADGRVPSFRCGDGVPEPPHRRHR